MAGLKQPFLLKGGGFKFSVDISLETLHKYVDPTARVAVVNSHTGEFCPRTDTVGLLLDHLLNPSKVVKHSHSGEMSGERLAAVIKQPQWVDDIDCLFGARPDGAEPTALKEMKKMYDQVRDRAPPPRPPCSGPQGVDCTCVSAGTIVREHAQGAQLVDGAT